MSKMTLRVMYQRITESRSHQHALGFNYEQLMVSHRTEIGKMIEGLYSGNDNVERATETEGDLCSMRPNGRAGRPDFNEKVIGQYKMQTADCRLQTADWVQNAD